MRQLIAQLAFLSAERVLLVRCVRCMSPDVADSVAKVENRKLPKISRMLIFSEFYRCNASERRYEGPWSFLREMMWSLASPRANRISGLYNFRSSPEKEFCNTICQEGTILEVRRVHVAEVLDCNAFVRPGQ